VLLDVGRHFFPVPFILKLLDLMALYKMNRFHWHLTEDQVCFWAREGQGFGSGMCVVEGGRVAEQGRGQGQRGA
jgi:hypothetical protein